MASKSKVAASVNKAAAKTATGKVAESAITDFKQIYDELQKILSKHSPPLTVKANTSDRYELSSVKNLVVKGRKIKEMCFGGMVIHKNFVSLYFYPIYTHPQAFNDLPVELKKCHKGKSCFNFKKADAKLFKQIGKMTKDGFEIYKHEEWV